jgi:predicted DCC family thiol-disulfide oxidoreductase YuxK
MLSQSGNRPQRGGRPLAGDDASSRTTGHRSLMMDRFANGWTGGQFSLARSVVGLYLLVAFGWYGIGQAGYGVTMAGEPTTGGWVARGVAALGLVLACGFALGWHRAAGVGLWGVLTGFALWLAWRPSAAILLILGALPLLVVACLPPAPYGSVPARGRRDPADGWRWPAGLFAAMWGVVGGFYALWAILLLPDLGWYAADRGMRLGVGEYAFPLWSSVAANWYLLVSWLVFLPAGTLRRLRPIAWGLPIVTAVVVLPLGGFPELVWPLLLLHLLTFDPHWLAPRETGRDDVEVVFYDGACGLCHRAVRFILAEDPRGLFRFSPLQGQAIRSRLSAEQRASLPDAIVVHCRDGSVLSRSAAVWHILVRLGGLWQVVGYPGRAIPRPVTDSMYRLVATVRHQLFPRPSEACPLMPKHLQARFLG